ncbi:MAG: HupE/UreJ family protein [Terriglobia bacterium]
MTPCQSQNTNIEIRNKSEKPQLNKSRLGTYLENWGIQISNLFRHSGFVFRTFLSHVQTCFGKSIFDFVHSDGFRISNFGFRILIFFWLLFLPVTAFAHIQKGEAAGFLTGLQHPISGLDHVLAMVAVGLWGAQLGAPAVWLLPVAFPMVMALGGMLGLMGVALPGIEYGIAASAILLGAAVMLELRPPLLVAAIMVGFFAIFHGHAHGTELPPGQSALLYSMGFVMATGCLHGIGIGIGTVHRWVWGQWLLRVSGGVVALGGIYFLWRAMA